MTDRFSHIDRHIDDLRAQLEQDRLLRPMDPWSDKEATEAARMARVARVIRSFADFDKVYFPPQVYTQGYNKPGRFHQKLTAIAMTPGVQIVLGPRDHGKTVHAKKVMAWLLVSGRVKVGGTYSHTLPTSRRIMADVLEFITSPRIQYDFGLEVIQANMDGFTIRGTKNVAPANGPPQVTRPFICVPFGEGRSVRGYSRLFSRPEFILADDVETLISPLGSDQVKERVRLISESYKSLTPDGTFFVTGNNFDVRCAFNRLLLEQNQGILSKEWRVHVFPAWSAGRALWPARFPAKTESGLRKMLRAKDEQEWRGEYQQSPIEPQGEIFPRECYAEYDSLPADAKGVAWCDPNLSLKSSGDTTAMGALFYSPSLDVYYVVSASAKSHSDSNELLAEYLTIKRQWLYRVARMGFDGNVSQESTWTNNVRNYCRLNQVPYPTIEYRRYNVDDLTKNVQVPYSAGRVRFPRGFATTEDGQRFVDQIFAFAGKKANRLDDAADWLISVFELLHEAGFARARAASGSRRSMTVADIDAIF